MPVETRSSPRAFHFLSRWRVRGSCGEVADIIDDPLALTTWWPAVYLSATEIAPPGPDGLGRRVALLTRGWLPYTLAWDVTVVERSYPRSATVTACGDLEGSGVWTFEQDGPCVNVSFDWRIELQKPFLRRLAPVLRPLFESNHRWAMRQGEASLSLELERRRATNDRAREAVAPPPGPVTYAAAGIVIAATAAGGTLCYLIVRARRRRRRQARLTVRPGS
jgi:hypothetical protein